MPRFSRTAARLNRSVQRHLSDDVLVFHLPTGDRPVTGLFDTGTPWVNPEVGHIQATEPSFQAPAAELAGVDRGMTCTSANTGKKWSVVKFERDAHGWITLTLGEHHDSTERVVRY